MRRTGSLWAHCLVFGVGQFLGEISVSSILSFFFFALTSCPSGKVHRPAFQESSGKEGEGSFWLALSPSSMPAVYSKNEPLASGGEDSCFAHGTGEVTWCRTQTFNQSSRLCPTFSLQRYLMASIPVPFSVCHMDFTISLFFSHRLQFSFQDWVLLLQSQLPSSTSLMASTIL